MSQFWSNSYNYSLLANIYPLFAQSGIYNFIGSNGWIRVGKFITNNSISSVLDYGCGHSNSIEESLSINNMPNIKLDKYDPFIEEYSTHPTDKSDLVVCYNVLNWVEPSYLQPIVQDIADLSNKFVLINIGLGPINNSDVLSEVYLNLVSNSGLTIVDSKIYTPAEKIAAIDSEIPNLFTDVVKNSILATNSKNLCILASK